MNNGKQASKLRRMNAGFTILELMIALSLGIVLLMGLMSIYIVAQQADNQNRALNANSEVARQVFRILDDSFKHAGYVEPLDSPFKNFNDFSTSCKGAKTSERYGSLTVDVAKVQIENIYRRYNSNTDPTKILPDKLMTAIGRISCGGMQPVTGCGAEFSAPPDVFNNNPTACSNESATGTSQAIEVAFQALATGTNSLSNLGIASAGNPVVDCTGTTDASDKIRAENGFIVNQFFLTTKDGEKSLTCQSNIESKDVALVQGVEEMMFRYITTVPETDEDVKLGESDSGRVLAAYHTAAELYDPANNLNWSEVVGIEVCIVVSSPDHLGSAFADLGKTQGDNRPTCARNSGTYANPVSKPDGKKDRYYQRFDRVFRIPNVLFLTN